MDYKKAGVDIEAGYQAVELMKSHVQATMRKEVLGGIGGFAGAFDLSAIKEMDEPVLLSGTDGCGTNLLRRRAALFPGLHRLWEELSQENCLYCQRCCSGLHSS